MQRGHGPASPHLVLDEWMAGGAGQRAEVTLPFRLSSVGASQAKVLL